MKKTQRPKSLKCRLRKNTDGRSTIQVIKNGKIAGTFSAQNPVLPEFIIFDKSIEISTARFFTSEEVTYLKHYFRRHKAERVMPLLSAIEETKNIYKEAELDKENIEAIKAKFNEMISTLEKHAA